MPRTVAVFGAGIAGLAAAHEFARLGYGVSVYEADHKAGGFFRTRPGPRRRRHALGVLLARHGPWYHNTFDLLRQIPFDEAGSVFDRACRGPSTSASPPTTAGRPSTPGSSACRGCSGWGPGRASGGPGSCSRPGPAASGPASITRGSTPPSSGGPCWGRRPGAPGGPPSGPGSARTGPTCRSTMRASSSASS